MTNEISGKVKYNEKEIEVVFEMSRIVPLHIQKEVFEKLENGEITINVVDGTFTVIVRGA